MLGIVQARHKGGAGGWETQNREFMFRKRLAVNVYLNQMI